jgi:parallel beta-helix repeat protein
MNDEFTCWVQNSVKYLSGPNEWVLDSKQKKIYYWPENGKPSNDIFAPCLREFILLEGNVGKKIPVKNITIKGLIFIQGDRDEWTSSDRRLQHDWDMLDKANAILRLRWAENCTIVGCRFENSSSSAIRLDLYSQHNCVDGNEITHIGGTGILLCGYGPGTVDLNNCNQIKGNHIRHCGEEFWHSPAIFIWQSGSNLVSGNLIHNMPYIGIVISGMRECYDRSAGMK